MPHKCAKREGVLEQKIRGDPEPAMPSIVQNATSCIVEDHSDMKPQQHDGIAPLSAIKALGVLDEPVVQTRRGYIDAQSHPVRVRGKMAIQLEPSLQRRGLKQKLHEDELSESRRKLRKDIAECKYADPSYLENFEKQDRKAIEEVTKFVDKENEIEVAETIHQVSPTSKATKKPKAYEKRTLLKDTFMKAAKQRYLDMLAQQYNLNWSQLQTRKPPATIESQSSECAKSLEDYEQRIKLASSPTVNGRQQDQLSVQYTCNLHAAVQIVALDEDEGEQTMGLSSSNGNKQAVMSENGSMGIRQESAHLGRGTKRPQATSFASNIFNFLSIREKCPTNEGKSRKLGSQTREGKLNRVLSSFKSNNDSVVPRERDTKIREIIQGKKKQELSPRIGVFMEEEKQKSIE